MVMRNDAYISCLECWYYSKDGCANPNVQPGETCGEEVNADDH